MARIGEFGTRREAAEPDTFGWFGAEIRVNPAASDTVLLDLADAAKVAEAGDDADADDVMNALATMKELYRDVVHEGDFDQFWRLARSNGQTIEDLTRVMMAVVELQAGRPTMPSSDSPAGQSPTAANSRDGSTSRAITHLSGRSDLQLAVVQANEARAARAG